MLATYIKSQTFKNSGGYDVVQHQFRLFSGKQVTISITNDDTIDYQTIVYGAVDNLWKSEVLAEAREMLSVEDALARIGHSCDNLSDLPVISDYRRPERYRWTVEISLDPKCVAEGVDLTPESLQSLLLKALPQLQGRVTCDVTSQPDREAVAREMGYKDESDRLTRNKDYAAERARDTRKSWGINR